MTLWPLLEPLQDPRIQELTVAHECLRAPIFLIDLRERYDLELERFSSPSSDERIC